MKDIMWMLVFVGIAASTSILCPLAARYSPPTITYAKDYDAALAESKTSGKPVLIVFKTNACKWCDKFEKESLADAKVVDYVSKNFVAVKLDNTHELAKAYGVAIYPTTVKVGTKKQSDGMLDGYRDAPTLLKFLEKK